MLKSSIGSLRVIGFLEGMSLLILFFIAVPLKYMMDIPEVSEVVGAIHGGLFILFILATLKVHLDKKWKFWKTTWKVLLSCMVPFGTFYVDKTILKPEYEAGLKGV